MKTINELLSATYQQLASKQDDRLNSYCPITGLLYSFSLSSIQLSSYLPETLYRLPANSCPLAAHSVATEQALALLAMRAAKTRENYERLQTIDIKLLAAICLSLAYPFSNLQVPADQPSPISLSLLSLLPRNSLLDYLSHAVHFTKKNSEKIPAFSLAVTSYSQSTVDSFTHSFSSYLLVLAAEFAPLLYSTQPASRKREIEDIYPELAALFKKKFAYQTVRSNKAKEQKALDDLQKFLAVGITTICPLLEDLGFEKVAAFLKKLRTKELIASLPEETLSKLLKRLEEATLEASTLELDGASIGFLEGLIERLEDYLESKTQEDLTSEIATESVSQEYEQHQAAKAKTRSLKEILEAKKAAAQKQQEGK
jgi:hypothetical protein